MKTYVRNFLWRLWVPIILIAFWQIILRNSTNPYFPAPSQILADTKYVINADWVKTSLRSSAITFLAGYLIGSISGILIGAFIGANQILREIFTPITNFIRSIPSVAKVPVIMAMLGIGQATRIATVAIAVLFPMLMTTIRAIATTDINVLEMAKLLRFGQIRTLFLVRLPAATGEILTGLQAAVQIGILVMVISEMLGSGIGLGAFIIHSQSTFMIADMWVGIFILGIIGLILNELFLYTERRVAPWYFSSKGLR